MGLPAGQCGGQLCAHRRRSVQETSSGAATQPLQHTTAEEIGAERLHVHRHHAHAVIGVERDQRANRLGLRANRRGVHDVRRAKEHVRNGHQSRALGDRGEHSTEIDRHAVVARHYRHVCPESGGECIEGVAHRREVKRGHHDFIALGGEVDRREDAAHRLCHGGHHDHRAGRRADQGRDFVAHFHWQLPPAIRPRADATRLPLACVVTEMIGHRRRHGPERMRDEIGGRPENREGVAESQQRVGSGSHDTTITRGQRRCRRSPNPCSLLAALPLVTARHDRCYLGCCFLFTQNTGDFMIHRSRTTILAALAAALMLPSIGAAQDLAPLTAPAPAVQTLVMAPTTVSEPTAAPLTMTLDRAAGPIATARPVGLQRYVADSPTAPMMKMQKSRNSSVTLMVFGLATLLVGTVVEGDAGTVLVLTGAGIGLVGLYRYLNQ